jgi:hypothetical protein
MELSSEESRLVKFFKVPRSLPTSARAKILLSIPEIFEIVASISFLHFKASSTLSFAK